VVPTTLTTPDGVYVLQVVRSGIKNLAGKTVGNSFSTAWTQLAQMMNMSQYWAPRTTPVTAVGVRLGTADPAVRILHANRFGRSYISCFAKVKRV
jgi:hypothetical protein